MPRKSNITASDFRRLRRLLADKPAEVLAHFGAAQVTHLAEVQAFHDIQEENPERAALIIEVATQAGIPIEPVGSKTE